MSSFARGSGSTLVVGGGPAGSVCAWKLASEGRTCLVAEKEELPRDKVCGGVLSHRAFSVITGSGMATPEELDRLTLKQHRTISFWFRGRHLRTYVSPSDPVRIVSRSDFDGFLLQRAADAGAEVRTGLKVESVDAGSAMTSEGEVLRFRELVGADGTVSLVRRQVSGRRSRKTGMGLHYMIPAELPQRRFTDLEIHFGHIPYGYIWVIPGKEFVNIGAGAVGSPAPPSTIVEALTEFMKTLSVTVSGLELHGAPLPSLALHRNLGRDNLYLAGDAAGLVDHVSGEGIGHAAESGIMVAECILSGGRRQEVLGRPGNCISIVRQSIFFRHLLYSRITRGTAIVSLRDGDGFARGYWDLISGRKTYTGMFSDILD